MKRLENRKKDIQNIINIIEQDMKDNKKDRELPEDLSKMLTVEENKKLFKEYLQLADLQYALKHLDYSKMGER